MIARRKFSLKMNTPLSNIPVERTPVEGIFRIIGPSEEKTLSKAAKRKLDKTDTEDISLTLKRKRIDNRLPPKKFFLGRYLQNTNPDQPFPIICKSKKVAATYVASNSRSLLTHNHMHSLQLSDDKQSDMKNTEETGNEQSQEHPFLNRVSNNTGSSCQNTHSLPDVKAQSDTSRSANAESGQP